MKTSGIYRILNKINGKQYIGSSINVEKRWGQHKSKLNLNYNANKHLQSAWNKYGEESFVFELLWKCEPDECLYEEQLALNNIKCEYNVCIVAGSPMTGLKMSDETKTKMSASRMGRVFTAESKAKIAASHIGIRPSNESKEKMRKAQSIALKAIRKDGLIIYFDSFKEAIASKYSRKAIQKSIENKTYYKGFMWAYL